MDLRIIDLLNPDVTVVFISLSMSPEADAYFRQAVNSSFKMQYLIDHQRLLILEVSKPPHFHPSIALAKYLLCDHQKIAQLVDFIGESTAYLVPAVAGIDELELCYVCLYLTIGAGCSYAWI